MSKYRNLAVERFASVLDSCKADRPADIIADIIHYCEANLIDFDEELRMADNYVAEELAVDEIEND